MKYFSLLYDKDLLGKSRTSISKENTCLHFVNIIMGHLMLKIIKNVSFLILAFFCSLQTLWIMQKLTLANITKWDYFGIFKLFTFYLRGTDAIMFLLYIFAIINLLRKMPIFAREWRGTRKSCFCSNICRRVVFYDLTRRSLEIMHQNFLSLFTFWLKISQRRSSHMFEN